MGGKTLGCAPDRVGEAFARRIAAATFAVVARIRPRSESDASNSNASLILRAGAQQKGEIAGEDRDVFRTRP